MKSYCVKPRIYMEREGLREVLRGVTQAFIVTDKFMHESGKVSYLTELLEELGIEYRIFSEVRPDPDIATVTKGIEMIADFKPQALLALGGGSPIDAAKAMNYLAARQGFITKCRFVAIPTTSGTGTEVSRFSVISDPEQSAKYALVEDELLPDAALLDAELTKSVPPAITADTGIDVLTHAIEAFVSTNANDFTDAAAEKAIKLVRSNLLRAYKTPEDMTARQKMHHASCLAGMAFSNAGLGLNHSMAHTLGGHFHIPHGRANAIFLPYVMSFNAGCRDKATPTMNRYARIARCCWLEGASMRNSAFNVIRSTKQLIKQLGLPTSIGEAGVPRADFMAALDEMVEAALQDTCTATNPRTCTPEELRALFQEAYEGRSI